MISELLPEQPASCLMAAKSLKQKRQSATEYTQVMCLRTVHFAHTVKLYRQIGIHKKTAGTAVLWLVNLSNQ